MVAPDHARGSFRTLSRSCVALFALSTAFPVVAGFLDRRDKPRWLGVADVAIAAVTFGVAALVASRARSLATEGHRARAFRVSQGLLAAIPLLLVAFFTLGERIDWTVLVIGLAWRAWLFLYTLPFLLAALETDR
jgi:hypothetical protein